MTPHGIWVTLMSQYRLKVPLNVKANVAESEDPWPISKYMCWPVFKPQITGTLKPVLVVMVKLSYK